MLHDIAQASNVRMPYSNAYVKYPEVDDWVPLKVSGSPIADLSCSMRIRILGLWRHLTRTALAISGGNRETRP